MKLIENASFDITEYCGHLIVTYLSDDKLAVRELLEVLDKAGYEYIDNEVGLHTVLKNSYTANIESLLDDCGCYILYVSKHFEDKKNRALRNNIWYQIGRLEIKKSQIVVPFVPHGTYFPCADAEWRSSG